MKRETIADALKKAAEAHKALDREWRAMLRRIGESPEGILLSGSSSIAEKERAAAALAKRLSIKPQNPAARSELMRMARTAGKWKPADVEAWVRSKILVPAILRAADDRYTPQPIRIGRRWLGGSRKAWVPMHLRWSQTSRWLRIRAMRYAEEALAAKPKKRAAIALPAIDEPATGGFADLTAEEMELLRFGGLHDIEALLRSIRKKIER